MTLLGAAAVAAQAQQGGEASAVVRPVPQPQTALVQFPIPGDVDSWQVPAQRAAATCPGLPADVLVAIAQVESQLGSESETSSAGAIGPMQLGSALWNYNHSESYVRQVLGMAWVNSSTAWL